MTSSVPKMSGLQAKTSSLGVLHHLFPFIYVQSQTEQFDRSETSCQDVSKDLKVTEERAPEC